MECDYGYDKSAKTVTTTGGSDTWVFLHNGDPVVSGPQMESALNRLIESSYGLGWQRGVLAGVLTCGVIVVFAQVVVWAYTELFRS